MKKRFFTKSRYKLCLECPTKVFYADKPDVYENSKLDDPYLRELARGGFQVGELAKYYYPSGVEVKETNHDDAIQKTNELLSKDQCTIYEAALEHDGKFVRVDVLVKNGDAIKLVEVKSKSVDPNQENLFYNRNGSISSEFVHYLYDIAFQAYVATKAKPDLNITSHLLLTNKSKVCSVERLNQKFHLVKNERGRNFVKVDPSVEMGDFCNYVLIELNVCREVDLIQQENPLSPDLDFFSQIEDWVRHHISDKKIVCDPGSQCKGCEFRPKKDTGKKSGFQECWDKLIGSKNLSEPLVIDIWNFRQSQRLIDSGVIFAKDVEMEHLEFRDNFSSGLSTAERQWEQVRAIKECRESPFVDIDGLSNRMTNVKYPLHFIDFETSMVALPFNIGRRPYEQIAFQFSHHSLELDGTVTHKGQFLLAEPGVFPNFEFVRALKNELQSDEGSIFRYAAHENTVLCQIWEQLRDSDEPDKKELMLFIQSITTATKRLKNELGTSWNGTRSMIDMWDMVKKFYYHPLTNGSNSIKAVLPAVLAESKYLAEKYSKPIYGSGGSIISLNFKDKVWLQLDSEGKIIDPYKQLEPVFNNWPEDKINYTLMGSDELADGGAAMTAYAKMQFEEMSEPERQALVNALLRYCELDTLAMVMIWEHWMHDIVAVK